MGKRDMWAQQFWMRARIASQFLTVVAMMGGLYMSDLGPGKLGASLFPPKEDPNQK
jgi:hypothetical protein